MWSSATARRLHAASDPRRRCGCAPGLSSAPVSREPASAVPLSRRRFARRGRPGSRWSTITTRSASSAECGGADLRGGSLLPARAHARPGRGRVRRSADALHGQGVGTKLLERLAAVAREHGIRVFTAQVMAENQPDARRVLPVRIRDHASRMTAASRSVQLQLDITRHRRCPPRADRNEQAAAASMKMPVRAAQRRRDRRQPQRHAHRRRALPQSLEVGFCRRALSRPSGSAQTSTASRRIARSPMCQARWTWPSSPFPRRTWPRSSTNVWPKACAGWW